MVSNRLQLSEELVASLYTERDDKCEWLGKRRKESEKRFLKEGIPLSFDEEWRLSNPGHFNKVIPGTDETNQTAVPSPFEEVEKIRLVFVDGVFSKDSSDYSNVDGMELTSLDELGSENNHWSMNIFGKIEKESQIISKRPLATFNTAFAKDGVLIDIKMDIKAPIELKYIGTTKNTGSLIRNVIRVGNGNKVKIIEHFEGNGWSNICTEINAERNAVVEHFRFKY